MFLLNVLVYSIAGSKLGVWISHGEGKFTLPIMNHYNIIAKYSYKDYPQIPMVRTSILQ